MVKNMTVVTFFRQKRALVQYMWHEKAKEIAYEKGRETDGHESKDYTERGHGETTL
jgi:hypothetical protein